MNRGLAAVFGAVLLVCFGLAGPAAAADPSFAQRDALSRALAIVDRGLGGTQNQQVRAARDALAVLASNSELAEDNWLLEPLQGSSPNLPRAQARLHAALDALETPSPTAFDPSANRQALASVLSDRRFHPQDLMAYLPGWLVPAAVLVVSIVHAVEKVIQSLIDDAFRLLVDFLNSDAFTVIALVLTVIVVPSVVFLYVRAVRRVLVVQAELPPDDGIRALSGPELLAAARIAGSRGEFREACHYAFLAALRVVEDRVEVRLDYSATNREQLRRLANTPGPLARQYGERLRPLIDRFDQVWYGQAVASDGDYRDIIELAEHLSEVGG